MDTLRQIPIWTMSAWARGTTAFLGDGSCGQSCTLRMCTFPVNQNIRTWRKLPKILSGFWIRDLGIQTTFVCHFLTLGNLSCMKQEHSLWRDSSAMGWHAQLYSLYRHYSKNLPLNFEWSQIRQHACCITGHLGTGVNVPSALGVTPQASPTQVRFACVVLRSITKHQEVIYIFSAYFICTLGRWPWC